MPVDAACHALLKAHCSTPRRSGTIVSNGGLHGQWWKYELAQMEAHPAKNQLVAFIQFQPSLRQRVGSWMILAGIALAVSVLVLLLQRDGGSPPGAESDASR
jgi:hypothetical protein